MVEGGFEAPEGPVQTLAVRRGERLKFEAHISDAAPPDHRLFDEDRRLAFREGEQEIDFHPGVGFERTFESAAVPREIKGLGNLMQAVLISQRPEEGYLEAGLLSDDHIDASLLIDAGRTTTPLYSCMQSRCPKRYAVLVDFATAPFA